MAQMGISSAELGYAVNALIDGAYAGDYFYRGDKIDLTILGREQYARSSQDVKALPIATPTGQLVPLEALADIKLTGGPEQINHRERVRAITVEVSPPPEMALEDAMETIRSQIVQPVIDSGQLQGGYRINLAGTADKLRDTWRALRFNIMLALVITYLLMAALFESWLYPLVIILTVPLGAVGGILGLNLLNVFLGATGQALQQLDVLTMLGFVILIGTVVNNPILIVHQSLNHMRDDGMSHRQAILESVRTRIRPIFMTTITTILGLLPLVLFPGAGSELYRGLGSVVLGGLLISTVFTLLLVPTLFSLMMDAKDAVLGFLRYLRSKVRRVPQAAEKSEEPAVV
jgi:HAE1 family hydrophobic/amphiphilic exporter-1